MGAKLLKWGVLIAVVGALIWVIKSSLSFDPHQQAQAAQAKITPGMTVAAVVKAMGRPAQEAHIIATEEAAKQNYSIPADRRVGYREDFLEAYGKEKLNEGFYFVYRFSERDLLQVHFDSDGKVQMAELVNPMKALGM